MEPTDADSRAEMLRKLPPGLHVLPEGMAPDASYVPLAQVLQTPDLGPAPSADEFIRAAERSLANQAERAREAGADLEDATQQRVYVKRALHTARNQWRAQLRARHDVRVEKALDSWGECASTLAELLADMDLQPKRYTRAQRLMVQSAIATLKDPEASLRDRRAVLTEVGKMMGAFIQREAPDDPAREDAQREDVEAKQLAGSSTQELLAALRKTTEK